MGGGAHYQIFSNILVSSRPSVNRPRKVFESWVKLPFFPLPLRSQSTPPHVTKRRPLKYRGSCGDLSPQSGYGVKWRYESTVGLCMGRSRSRQTILMAILHPRMHLTCSKVNKFNSKTKFMHVNMGQNNVTSPPFEKSGLSCPPPDSALPSSMPTVLCDQR